VKIAIPVALCAAIFLAGCGPQTKDAPAAPATPKWQGPAYHIAFDTAAPKPNPSGVSLPGIKFTANPDALEKRATLVVKFDSSGVKTNQLVINQIILAPFDISGSEGALSADTIDVADKGLAHLLTTYCVKGKAKVSVLLTRSSLNPQADDDAIAAKRLSDWISTDVTFKNPHPGCKL